MHFSDIISTLLCLVVSCALFIGATALSLIARRRPVTPGLIFSEALGFLSRAAMWIFAQIIVETILGAIFGSNGRRRS